MPTAKKPLSQLPSLLCPVDFSEHSRAALRYAGAIADHFGAHLTLMTVDDPLLAEAAAATGRVPSLEVETLDELKRFCSETLTSAGSGPTTIHCRAAVGKPAAEISRLAEARHANLIVMGLHASGLCGPRMGSVTYRVLCLTHALVLALPPTQSGAPGGDSRRRSS
jgi:universal stress protein A